MQPVRVAAWTPVFAAFVRTGVTLDDSCVVVADALPIGPAPTPPNPTTNANAAAPPNIATAVLVSAFISLSSPVVFVCCG
jgi:hypothetical protein